MIRPTITIYFDGAWVDVSGYAYSVRVERGRRFPLDPTEPGTCMIRFHNDTGVFLPSDLADPRLRDDADSDYLYDDAGTNILMTDTGLFGYDEILPGKAVRVDVDGNRVFTGIVEDWHFEYRTGNDAKATAVCVDGLAKFGRQTFLEWTTTDYQRPTDRLDDICDRSEVNYTGTRTFDKGLHVLQADLVTHGSNVLNYMQLVAESDGGFLFADRDNALTYLARSDIAGKASQITLGQSIYNDLANIELASAAEYLWNRASVDRIGGIAQTVNDTTSQTAYGVRSLSITGLLMNNDTDTEAHAQLLVDTYKDPKSRIGSITVMPDKLSAGQQTALLTAELGDVVTVTWTPTGAYESTTGNHQIEGIHIEATAETPVRVTYRLAPLPPAETTGWFILDDATYGKLDTAVLSH